MTLVARTAALAAALIIAQPAASAQTLGVLRLKVVVMGDDRKPAPVPRHVLLVSDNPTSAPPRRVVTGLDGTAELSLRPGNYTVESDGPAVFQGKAYQWTQTVDVVAGRSTMLELTVDNADIAPVASSGSDPSALLMQWQDSVVALWTPTAHASAFVVDAKGRLLTNQRVVGAATSVEVQISPTVKVTALVLAADAARDVAVLRIDPGALGSIRPLPLGCDRPQQTPVAEGQPLSTIGTPLRGQKSLASATVRRVDAHAIASDLILARGSAGGPVFAADGSVVGITSVSEDGDANHSEKGRIVRIADACAIVASTEKKMTDAFSAGAHLPVEPTATFPPDALKDVVQRRVGSLNPYQITTSDFDVAFITPVHVYATEYQKEQARDRERSRGAPTAGGDPAFVRPLMDFSNWSDYVADVPPVLLVRVTPKLVESFWTTVARGAARTQGVALPPIRHFKSGFSRLRAFCGDAEVTPIHPFKLELRVSEDEAVYEGLYVFDPAALGPQCGSVKLVLASEKAPEKPETRAVEPNVIQQIWDDFTAYRAQK